MSLGERVVGDEDVRSATLEVDPNSISVLQNSQAATYSCFW